MSNAIDFGGLATDGAVRYLWTLPMFHCNGWGFPNTLAAVGGANVCLRDVERGAVEKAFLDHGVTHLCGAPIVVRLAIAAAEATLDRRGGATIRMMTGGAPPPAATLRAAKAVNLDVTHVYGMTETYGPAALCQVRSKWASGGDEAAKKARQGVPHAAGGALDVVDPETGASTPADGETVGELVFRGNVVMKGYLKNEEATADAFRRGSLATGDLGVRDPDGYARITDRSKDIVISGGENVSSVEVESHLMEHDAVEECAVVARPDERWGETPCAFVELKPGREATTEADLLDFARGRLAGFKRPKTVVFGPLPKTSTGKIQKFVLRDRARDL